MVRPTQSALVARRIGETRIGSMPIGAISRVSGPPRRWANSARHRLIGFDRDDRAFRSVGAAAGPLSRDWFGFRCDSDLAQLAALRAGVGIGGCQENIARRSPELTRVLPREIAFTLEIWLVMHEDMKATPRVRLLFEHLAAGLTGYVHGRSELPSPPL